MSAKIKLKAFVKWNGGPSLWIGDGENPIKRLGEVLRDTPPLRKEQKRSIELLMTDVMGRHSLTTYPSHPIQLHDAEMEGLLKILRMNQAELFNLLFWALVLRWASST